MAAASDDGNRLGDLYELLVEIRDQAQNAVNAWDNDEPVRSIARHAMAVHGDASLAYDQLASIAQALNG